MSLTYSVFQLVISPPPSFPRLSSFNFLHLSFPRLPKPSALLSLPRPTCVSLGLSPHVLHPPFRSYTYRRLKYEETIKLWLISMWTGGGKTTGYCRHDNGALEIHRRAFFFFFHSFFLIPGMTFYRILLNEKEQSSGSPFRQPNYHEKKRAQGRERVLI